MIFLKNFNFVKTVKSVFLSIGIFISLIGIALLFVSNFNIGNFLTIFFGLIIVLLVIFWSKLAKSLKTLGIAVLRFRSKRHADFPVFYIEMLAK